jgi:SOS-response transcriptional repressor LexA
MERVLERESEPTVLDGVVRELGVSGACLFLAGEAGIGKTTLVRTLRNRVREKMPVPARCVRAASGIRPHERVRAAGQGALSADLPQARDASCRQAAIELRRSASEANRVPVARRGEAGMPCELGQNAETTLDYWFQ